MVLEPLASICKREKSSIHSHGFFPSKVCLPAPDGGVDRLSTKAFLPWSDLVCPLPTQAPYSSLVVLPPRRGEDAPRVDLMASQTDLVPYQQDLRFDFSLSSDASRGVREQFPGMFPELGLWGEASIAHVPAHLPEYSPDHSGDCQS